jgi:DNA-binding IscR family transcriptional regulator
MSGVFLSTTVPLESEMETADIVRCFECRKVLVRCYAVRHKDGYYTCDESDCLKDHYLRLRRNAEVGDITEIE